MPVCLADSLAFERSLGQRLSSCSLSVDTFRWPARGSWRCRPAGSSNAQGPGQMPPSSLADLGSLGLCWDVQGIKCQPRRLTGREAEAGPPLYLF